MEKVKVTEDQARALDLLHGTWKGVSTKRYYPVLISEKTTGGWGSTEFTAAETLTDDDFIKALYFGYEVGGTPEEEIREYYRELDTSASGPYPDMVEALAIEFTLDTLGIKIEGVNA